jgi:DNA-binding NarL/FixJ family response regulator
VPTPRFAHVDDTTALRASLGLLLPDLDFVSAHPSVEDLLAHRPDADVVILDLHLATSGQPEATQGPTAIRLLVDAGYRVCVYTQEQRRFVLAACLAAGATGVVSKTDSLAATDAAFRAVAAGELVVPPAVAGLLEVLVRRGSLTIVSPRQRQVLAARARGLTYAEMSRTMFLAESTLRGYWIELSKTVEQYLKETSPGDIEHALGLGPGDLLAT